jgi:hypothetical protein
MTEAVRRDMLAYSKAAEPVGELDRLQGEYDRVVLELYRSGGMRAVVDAIDRNRRQLQRLHIQGVDGWIV